MNFLMFTKNLRNLVLITSVLFIFSSCGSKKEDLFYQDYSLEELYERKEKLLIKSNNYKLEYYLKRIKREKASLRSLATIKDKKLIEIMDKAPDKSFESEWEEAKNRMFKYGYTISEELKELSLEDKSKSENKEERDCYCDKQRSINKELVQEDSLYNSYHDDLLDKLKQLWLYKGYHLLHHFKSKNEKIPIDWLKRSDTEKIVEDSTYLAFKKNIREVKRQIKKREKLELN